MPPGPADVARPGSTALRPNADIAGMSTIRTMKPVTGLAVVLGIALLAVALLVGACGSSGGSGKVAPAFSAQTLDGTAFSLADYRGKPLVLAFMASW